MDVEVEQPEIHHHEERAPRGYRAILPLLALFVSLLSIAIAYHHGKVMEALVHQNERLVQANSLPHIQLYGSNVGASGDERVSFVASNAGVGPAEIRTAQISIDGRPVRNLAELMRACCNSERRGITTSTLQGAMIRPGEALRYIDLPATGETRQASIQLDEARRRDRIVTRICYCSVFDECWTRSSANALSTRPQRVNSCPAEPVPYTE